MIENRLECLFYETTYGKNVFKCIQCGSCSASCPLTDHMDHAPREIFGLIRDGEIKEALCSNTPWFCVSCYQCTVRCPREIPVTDLMYTLKQMAVKQGLVDSSHKMPHMYQAFSGLTRHLGRINEPMVMALYSLRHPGAVIDNLPLALKLLQKGRLDILPQKIKEGKNMSQLLRDKQSGGFK